MGLGSVDAVKVLESGDRPHLTPLFDLISLTLFDHANSAAIQRGGVTDNCARAQGQLHTCSTTPDAFDACLAPPTDIQRLQHDYSKEVGVSTDDLPCTPPHPQSFQSLGPPCTTVDPPSPQQSQRIVPIPRTIATPCPLRPARVSQPGVYRVRM
jgi:hypothetical protein